MPTPSNRLGRPPKYGRAARAVTITLPEDVLARLRAVDADLGRAIVSLSEQAAGRAKRATAVGPVEVAPYGNHGVIVVTPAKALKRLPGVELVPVGNGRAIISIRHDKPIAQLELDLRDVLDRDGLDAAERRTVEAVSEILRDARQSAGVTLQPRTIIVLQSTGAGRSVRAAARRGRASQG